MLSFDFESKVLEYIMFTTVIVSVIYLSLLIGSWFGSLDSWWFKPFFGPKSFWFKSIVNSIWVGFLIWLPLGFIYEMSYMFIDDIHFSNPFALTSFIAGVLVSIIISWWLSDKFSAFLIENWSLSMPMLNVKIVIFVLNIILIFPVIVGLGSVIAVVRILLK